VERLAGAPAAAHKQRVGFESLSTLRVPLWIAAAYMLLTTKADPDLFGHLRFGLDILSSGHLSSTDPYSFTADMPWTNHEWLSEWIMALTYSGAGVVGLIAMKAVVASATFGAITRSTRNASPLWRWPGALLAVLGMLPIFLTIRPQIWTLLFLVLTCWILTGPWRRRYWLPLIFLLWANMHGGWLVGMGVLAVWSGIELVERGGSRPPLWLIAATPTVCLLATLINPYGWHLWEFLARTVRLTRDDIIEWQPLWRADAGSIVHWLAALVWAGLAIRSAEHKPWKSIAAVAILAYGSLRVLRLVPLLAPSAVVLLIPYLKQRDRAGYRSTGYAKTAVDIVCAGVAFAMAIGPVSPACVLMTGTWVPNFDTARAISAADLTGRLVNPFNWGEYAIWHFGPKLRVSIDGRRETVYSERVIEEQRKVATGDGQALARLKTVSPEYVWLPRGKTDNAGPWLASHGYRIDVSTPSAFVAVREDLPRVPTVAAAAAPPCFPGS
jgi:hypothetical protein